MLLRLTVLRRDGSPPRLVEVRADPGHLAHELAEAMGLAALHVGGERVPDDLHVGSPPLLDGAVLVAGDPPAGEPTPTPTTPLSLAVVAGPDSGRTVPLGPGTCLVGRSPVCDLAVADAGMSRVHAEVILDRDGIRVRDVDATNGSRLDGSRCSAGASADGAALRTGQEWRVGHSTLAVVPSRSRPARLHPTGEGTLAVSPRPVVASPGPAARVDFPARPAPPRRRRMPWVVLVAPLPFAAVLAAFFGPRMLAFALLSPLMMLGSVLGDRSTSRREHRDDLARWRRDTARAADRMDAAVALERQARLVASPDPATVVAAARGDSTRLWERRRGETDFLRLRLGLGTLPSLVEVQDGSSPERLHPPVEHVPVSIDLGACGVLGLSGPDGVREGLARSVLGQILVLHSPHEVEVTVVASDGAWPWPFVQAPHLRSRPEVPGTARTGGHEDADRLLAPLARRVVAHDPVARTANGTTPEPPVHVLVVDDPQLLRGSTHLREVLSGGPEAGVLVLVVGGSPDVLPHETRVLASVDDDGVTGVLAGDDVPTTEPWVVDAVDDRWAARVGAGLAPLRDATPAPGRADLPTSCRLVDVLALDPDDPEGVLRRWRDADPASLTVPVGVGEDGVVHLDLRGDGPHALLAGTTGSGKSELLQTWVTSLALHHSPEDVTFVLVDYKGGAAFAECARLPHTVGMLTDLDPHHAERAIASLDAELTRRERLLAEDGASDLDAYDGPTPLPRLLLVIDEFRMLAEQQPDVLARLIRIAAVGRSLGVHVVLATQRPGGIVSADVRANVNLRLSLRVRDGSDSDDVLGCPDAAAIPDDLPGRLLVGSGSGRPLAVQAARVGGGQPDADGEPLLVRDVGEDWPAPPREVATGPSDLSRIVASVQQAARARGVAAPHRPWLPPLPAELTTQMLPTVTTAGSVPFGLVDVPERQSQTTLGWSPATGHWMVVGGPRTGRTTTVRSLVLAATAHLDPTRLHIHVCGDGSAGLARLAELPHVGSVVDLGDRPVLRRFLGRLRSEVESRRTLLRRHGHPDLDAWPSDDPERPPHLLLVVDGWSRLTDRDDPLELEDVPATVEGLVRDGAAVGLRLVATGGRELLTGRLASLVTRRLVHHLADRGDTALAGVPKGVMPEQVVPGRAVLLPDGHAAQVALPREVVDETHPVLRPDRHDRPWVVGPLPTEVDTGDLSVPAPQLPVGLGGTDGIPVAWDLGRDGRRVLVAGPPGSGRSSAAHLLASGLVATGAPTVLVTGSPDAVAPVDGVRQLGPDAQEELLDLRRRHPDLAVVVDDADRLDDGDMQEVLREIVRRVDQDRGVIAVTATTSSATTQLRGLVAEVARTRSGVLLQPSARGDGDAFGLRVPALDPFPGRGYLVRRGRSEEVQLALLGRAQVPSGGVRGGAILRDPVASNAQA